VSSGSVQGVVLVAGEGTRLRPLTFTTPKPLVPVLGKPFIVHVIEALRDSGISDITLVIGYLGKLFRETLGDGSNLGVSIKYAIQEERLGIAHAIYRAIETRCVKGPFVVHLGDNYFDEGTSRFVREFVEGNYDVFIVLTRTKDPTRFGYVVLENGKVKKLIEKPKNPPPGGYTLAGFYAFRDPDLVVKAFKDLKPSWRGEYEITDLIQWFVDRGYSVGYAITNGWWKDIGTPDDLLDLIYLMLDKVKTRIEGEVEGEVRGRVIVERGAVVEGRVYGPAYIGRGAYIDRSAVIEHYTSIEECTQVMSGHIARSLIMSNATLNLNRLRLVDSIVGRYSKIMCTRELHGSIRLLVSDYSYIEL